MNKLIFVEAFFENGNMIKTSMNTNLADKEIEEYYVNKFFNFNEKLVLCTGVKIYRQ